MRNSDQMTIRTKHPTLLYKSIHTSIDQGPTGPNLTKLSKCFLVRDLQKFLSPDGSNQRFKKRTVLGQSSPNFLNKCTWSRSCQWQAVILKIFRFWFGPVLDFSIFSVRDKSTISAVFREFFYNESVFKTHPFYYQTTIFGSSKNSIYFLNLIA